MDGSQVSESNENMSVEDALALKFLQKAEITGKPDAAAPEDPSDEQLPQPRASPKAPFGDVSDLDELAAR